MNVRQGASHWMKATLIHSKLQLKQSHVHGYGVFAEQDIQVGDIIEECYTLPRTDNEKVFDHYYFKGKDNYVLPLGFGAIYNHSKDHNAEYEYDSEHGLLVFSATRTIKQGEEIFIYYGENWFGPRKMKLKQTSLVFKLRKLFGFSPVLFRCLLVLGVLFLVRVFA